MCESDLPKSTLHNDASSDSFKPDIITLLLFILVLSGTSVEVLMSVTWQLKNRM